MNDTNKRLTILTTGAGAPGAAGIFKALRIGAREEGRSLRIVACDMDSDAYGFHLADGHYTIPAGDDPNFIESIIDICRNEGPDAMFCWVDPELAAVAGHKKRIEEVGVKVLVSGPRSIDACLDKHSVFEAARELGMAPRFRVADSAEELQHAARGLGYPKLPVCFKPAEGYGGRGFRVLQPDALAAENMFSEKPDNTVTTLEDVIARIEGIKIPRLVVMEYLPGREYTVDMLLDSEGEPVVTIPRERAKVKLGISNIARLERNGELAVAAESLAKKLGLRYNANIQFRMDSKSRPKLVEVQPRLAGTTAASVGAGANLPWLAAKLALGEPLPEVSVNWNTRMKRFWEEVYSDGERNWRI